MNDKSLKSSRILDIYVRFCEDKIINKLEESKRFSVDERSIQRDIDDLAYVPLPFKKGDIV